MSVFHGYGITNYGTDTRKGGLEVDAWTMVHGMYGVVLFYVYTHVYILPLYKADYLSKTVDLHLSENHYLPSIVCLHLSVIILTDKKWYMYQVCFFSL